MNPSFPHQHQLLHHQPTLYHNLVPAAATAISIPSQLPQPLQQVQVTSADSNANSSGTGGGTLTKAQRRMLGESEAARAKRLAKNAERMRQKRANETYEEYKIRLAKNAEANRRRRANETEAERALRHMRNAMRQRLRRAMETPEQKAIRKARLAQRMREIRANETPEQRKIRLEKGAARARHKFLTESQEERAERNRKKAEYARAFRSSKGKNSGAGQNEDPTKNVPVPMDIKVEHPPSTHQHQQHNLVPQPELHPGPPTSAREPSYPINYTEFGAAFPTFFNYPHLKNGGGGGGAGQQSAYSYPSQPYYPDLSVPTPYMKTTNDRPPAAPFSAPKENDKN